MKNLIYFFSLITFFSHINAEENTKKHALNYSINCELEKIDYCVLDFFGKNEIFSEYEIYKNYYLYGVSIKRNKIDATEKFKNQCQYLFYDISPGFWASISLYFDNLLAKEISAESTSIW